MPVNQGFFEIINHYFTQYIMTKHCQCHSTSFLKYSCPAPIHKLEVFEISIHRHNINVFIFYQFRCFLLYRPAGQQYRCCKAPRSQSLIILPLSVPFPAVPLTASSQENRVDTKTMRKQNQVKKSQSTYRR